MQSQYDLFDTSKTHHAPHNAAICTNLNHMVNSATLEQIMVFHILVAAKAKKSKKAKPTHAGLADLLLGEAVK